MLNSFLAPIPLLLLPLALHSMASAQQVPTMSHRPSTGALGKLDSATELTGATFDLKDQKLLFTFPDSTTNHIEPITPQSIPWAVQNKIPYRIDATRKDNHILLSNPRLEFLAKWDSNKDEVPHNSHFETFERIVKKIPQNALWIPNTLRPELTNATVAAIVHSPKDDPSTAMYVESYYLQEKSYHDNTQISFSVFEQARQTCIATCAIRRKGKPHPHGSGILIGANLVLTCEHNFLGTLGPADKCDILFHFTDKDEGAVFPVANKYYTSSALDFCLLELGPQTKPAGDPLFKMPTPPVLGVEPELAKNAGIYVAGYPGGRPLSVALNCQVVYPYWLESQDAVKELIGGAILRMFTSPSDYQAYSPKYLPKVTEFFTANYRQNGAAGFYFRPQDRPTIGADPDTKRGNSGGPVFDIERNAVIGLLRAGAPDDGNFPAGANFANFEAIVPISAIVSELKNKKPEWKTKYGVTFSDD